MLGSEVYDGKLKVGRHGQSLWAWDGGEEKSGNAGLSASYLIKVLRFGSNFVEMFGIA